MKKLFLMLIVFQLFLGITVAVAQESSDIAAEVINVGSPVFTQNQGDNGWYLCWHESGQVSELVWSEENGGWFSSLNGAGPKIIQSEMLPSTTKDLDFKFIPNKGGLYNLSWDISWLFTTASGNAAINADGMTLSIILNGETIWEKNAALQEKLDCSLLTMLEAGDEIHFRADCNNQAWYDSFTGYPNVELVGIYYQKNADGITELTRDRCNKIYIADDLVARISSTMVMPTEEYSLMRRYIVPKDGRFRIYGTIDSKDETGIGNILRFYKNGKLIREQLCLCGEETSVDIRLLCEKNDEIDIEVSVNEYEGFNYSTWDVDIEYIPGTVRDCANTTTSGFGYSIVSSVKLSEYISGASKYDTQICTEVYGERYPMIYDSTAKRWQETKLDKSGITRIPKNARETLDEYLERITIADAGYVSTNKILSTRNWTPGSATVIGIPITQKGTLLIDGDFALDSAEDGEVVKVFLNGECIWSNRIGGEEAIHFAEPYDSKYFIDDATVLANVNDGDIIEFRFSKWRSGNSDETVDVSGITLNYIEGITLSKQTKWKLNNSVVVDTISGKIYCDGELMSGLAELRDGTTYIPAVLASELFGYTGTEETVSFREAAELNENSVVWIANRFAVAHEGIPGMYTWNEMSEIKTYSELKGGVLYE